MARLITPDELRSPDTIALVRWLLGKALVRTIGRKRIVHVITEVEAYDGERDLACHASKGRTGRTEVMYQPGGIWYVYLCYGMHEMLNRGVRTRKEQRLVSIFTPAHEIGRTSMRTADLQHLPINIMCPHTVPLDDDPITNARVHSSLLAFGASP